MNKEFPQTEKQQKIYDFWNVRGFGSPQQKIGNFTQQKLSGWSQ